MRRDFIFVAFEEDLPNQYNFIDNTSFDHLTWNREFISRIHKKNVGSWV